MFVVFCFWPSPNGPGVSEVWPEASSTSEEYGISIPCKNEIFSIMKGIDKIVYLNFPYYRIGSTRKRVISSKEIVIKIKKTINKITNKVILSVHYIASLGASS